MAAKKRTHSAAHRKAISDGLKLYHSTKASSWVAEKPLKLKKQTKANEKWLNSHGKKQARSRKAMNEHMAKRDRAAQRAAKSKTWKAES